jgi:excisionase family DNA binding protein
MAESRRKKSTSSAPKAVASEQLADANAIARLLKTTPDFVYALVKRNGIPYLRLGGKILRFHIPTINAWIAKGSASESESAQTA